MIALSVLKKFKFYQVMWTNEEANNKRYMQKNLNFLDSFLTKIPMIATADSAFNIYLEKIDNEDLNVRTLISLSGKFPKLEKLIIH